MQKGANASISLRDAPARFLTVDWGKLVELTGSETKALDALSNQEPAIIAFYRRGTIEEGRATGEGRKEEEAYLLAEKMRADCRSLFASTKLRGTGIFSGTGLSQDIPAEMWTDLALDFANSRAAGRSGNYEYVAITEAPRTNHRDDLHA
jgi:hypothetical protein